MSKSPIFLICLIFIVSLHANGQVFLDTQHQKVYDRDSMKYRMEPILFAFQISCGFLCSSSVIVVIDAFLPERGSCLFFLTASIEAVSVEICVNIFIFLRSGACIRHCLSWQGPPLCSVLHMALILGGNSERVAHL